MKRNLSVTLLLSLLLAVSLAGCAVNPVTGRKELAIMEVTVDQEVELGGKAYTQALQKMGGVYPDPALNAYVDRVGQRLARVSHRPELTYRFNVVNESSPNAFALPGGYIAITRGLLVSMEDEAQLAAVLAHEIGHVTARHSVQEIQRSTLMGTTVGLLGALAGDSGYGQALTRIGGLTADLLGKSYSRDQEYEADALSVDYLARSGYSLNGAVELQQLFLRKFESGTNPDWVSGLFRTHPFSRDRLTAIEQRIIGTYGNNRGGAGLDRNAYRRASGSLDKTVAAYELYDQARKLEQQGDQLAALETYHKAMQQAPDHGLLLSALGMAYLRNEDLVPARRYLIRAVNTDPNYYESRMGLGYIYLQNRESARAVTELDASLKLLPTVQAAYLLGQAEEQEGNFTRAKQLYESVVQADRNGKLGKAAATRLRTLGR
ncbi:MAG: peptidase M48 [Desulfuromonas sp.]|nr:MAG: peptidase M48 [Desulfuromonas sp.]